jgi:hypothetical protein
MIAPAGVMDAGIKTVVLQRMKRQHVDINCADA